MSRNLPVSTRKANAADHAAALGAAGLPTKPSFRISKMLAPIERSSLVGSIDPRSVIELALVHRLANLLWRLRRACAIETGLFETHGELLSARRQDPSRGPSRPGALQTNTGANGHTKGPGSNGRDDPPMSEHDNSLSTTMRAAPGRLSKSRTIAQCFLRLSHLDPTLLDRAGAYEARLWRQAAQTIWTLEAMRLPPPPMRQRLRHRAAPFIWHRQR